MLYHLLYGLHQHISVFNVFRYITFRIIYAGLSAFLISILLAPYVISALRYRQVGQYIRRLGPETHKGKAGTPTMGGILIIAAVALSVLAWMDLRNFYLWVILLVMLGFSLVGFSDDWLKQKRKRNRGLSAGTKFLLQVLIATAAGLLLFFHPDFSTRVTVPFVKDFFPDFGWWYLPFAVFVIVGASNAVNLTDGLDGLAIGPVIIASATYMIFAYVAGHSKIATYLQISAVPGCGEVAILCGALAGAGLGFLWYNAYPAQVFMGDVGSLPLGAVLGTVALVTKQEFLLVIVGGVFVAEAVSVILQVGYFKWSKGKRIFKMAPLHHHFELKGWPEPKVVVRFWIVAIVLSLIAVSTLKLR